MKTTKVKTVNKEEVPYVPRKFSYLPLGEAMNNLDYWRLLARANSFTPLDGYLTPRKDHYGPVKDVWSKEVIASYDFSLTPVVGSIPVIAFNVTGIDRPRRVYDLCFDNISHIKTIEVTKEKNKIKYLILKPLDKEFLAMKSRTQVRINGIYEKNFMGLNK
jgi:hypothetical protein